MDEDELSRLHRSSVYLDSQAHMAKIFSKDPQSWPGAIKIQNAWRGYRARKSLPLRINESLHLGYELFVMKKRLYRRKMLVGFFKHVVFMLLLSVVVWLQLGQTIHNRHELEHTVDEMVQSLETPEGLGFNSVSEVGDAWQWVRRGLFTKIANADELNHVYVRTYNLLVGSIRLETTRVSSSSCSWPDSLPRAYRLKSIPPDCYGKGGTARPGSVAAVWSRPKICRRNKAKIDPAPGRRSSPRPIFYPTWSPRTRNMVSEDTTIS